MRFGIGGAITSPSEEAWYADPLRHVLGEMPGIKICTALIRDSVPDRDRSFTGQHAHPSFLSLNCYRGHCYGREAFKACLDALSDFCVMNTSEGTGHDDLTGSQKSPRRERWLARRTIACSGFPIGFPPRFSTTISPAMSREISI
jgi:hypothetical protein